jgi:hypothetical protein
MNGLSASGLADLAGTTAAEVHRLVELGILVPRDGIDLFLDTDVQKVRLAVACERAGLPMEAIASPDRSDPWRSRIDRLTGFAGLPDLRRLGVADCRWPGLGRDRGSVAGVRVG